MDSSGIGCGSYMHDKRWILEGVGRVRAIEFLFGGRTHHGHLVVGQSCCIWFSVFSTRYFRPTSNAVIASLLNNYVEDVHASVVSTVTLSHDCFNDTSRLVDDGTL